MKNLISAYSPEDKKELQAIYCQILREEWQLNTDISQLESDLEESIREEVFLVARHNQKVIGFISWYEPDAYIHHLYVKKEQQHKIDPLVISWGYNAMFPSGSPFLDYHQTNGTRDYSAFLTIPAAIQFMNQHNWEKVSANSRQLVQVNALALCDLLNSTPLAPITDDFILQLFSAPIKTREPEKLQRHFFDMHKIEVPVMRHKDNVYLRYSINAFNSQEDLDKLFAAITAIKKETGLIE